MQLLSFSVEAATHETSNKLYLTSHSVTSLDKIFIGYHHDSLSVVGCPTDQQPIAL